MTKTKILFVCHGNICRSPMAEFVMKDKLRRMGADETGLNIADCFEVASAATSTEEIGNSVYPPARRMLYSHGIDCSGKRARQMTAGDYDYYDHIVLMDQNNLRNLRWILPAAIYERESSKPCKVSLLMEWAGLSRDVADPWYTGDFQATWDDVNLGCDAMVGKLMAQS